MIKFLIIILIIYILYLNSIKIKNYMIRKSITKFTAYVTFKNKLDKKLLIKHLNTFEIFDYSVYYNILLFKTDKKSYLILDNEEELTKKDIENNILIIVFQKDPKTIKIILDHGIFDGHLLINIFNDYHNNKIRNNENYKIEEITYTSILNLPKKYSILKKKYITEIVNVLDFQPFIINKYKYNKTLYTISKISVLNKQNEFKKYNINISKMDIVFSIVCKKFMNMFNRKVLNAMILKSYRSINSVSIFDFPQSSQIKNNKFTCGNMIYSHIIQIKDDDLLEMADSIRKSYDTPNFSVKPIDIQLISWHFKNENIISMKTAHDYTKNVETNNIMVFISFDQDNYLIMT